MSGLKELENYLLQREGKYGVQRLQRAADEIPGLEHMFTPEALRQAFSGDNAKALMTLNPADFEKYASPIPERTRHWPSRGESKPDKANLPTAEYIQHLRTVGGFHDVPMLEIDKEEQGLPMNPFIAGHEGRHRNRAMAQAGKNKSLVVVHPRAELREPLPRRYREDYINALKKELAMTGNLVVPQRYTESKDDGWTERPVHRPAIQMPDIYAQGGQIQHKADGGIMDTPSLAQMRVNLAQHRNPDLMDSIGVNEALDMEPKMFMNPAPKAIGGIPSIGGVSTKNGLPVGGVDTNPQQPGQQLNPQPVPMPGQPQPGQPGAPGAAPAPGGAPTGPSGGAPAQMGNMLQMTPQGQALSAMAPPTPPATGAAPGMASGGSMRLELMKKKARDAFPHMNDGGQPPKRRVFNIMPATQGAVKPHSRFSEYDASSPTIASLARAFDEAIAHHLALPHDERKMNSVRASEMVSNHVGRTSDNKPKDLLGKNAKLIKSEKGGEEAIKLDDGRGVETTGLALAPAFMQGQFHTCPNSASCKEECLGKTSGNYFKLGGGTNLEEFKGPRLNSLNKTLAMINDPHSFAVKLYDEIQDAKAAAAQNNNHLGVRLNVLSDINPRVHKSIINGHPDVTFYDYTKNNTNPIAPNHHYTYSSTGVSDQDVHNPHSNWKQMRRRLEGGDNVAMAFTHNEHLPHQIVDEETGKVFKVINGDSHDFRPLDMVPEGEHGVIVGLKNKKAIGEKHNAHIDSNGFFVKYDPKLLKKEDGKYARLPNDKISPKTGKPMLGETIPQNRTVRIEPQGDAPRAKSNDEGWHV